MKTVLVDTSGFYAFLDGKDPSKLMRERGIREAIARDEHLEREERAAGDGPPILNG